MRNVPHSPLHSQLEMESKMHKKKRGSRPEAVNGPGQPFSAWAPAAWTLKLGLGTGTHA